MKRADTCPYVFLDSHAPQSAFTERDMLPWVLRYALNIKKPSIKYIINPFHLTDVTGRDVLIPRPLSLHIRRFAKRHNVAL